MISSRRRPPRALPMLRRVDRLALLQRQRAVRAPHGRRSRRRASRQRNRPELHAASLRAQRLLAQRGDDLAHDRDGDLGGAHGADVEADRARECARAPLRRSPWRASARGAWRASFASRARRCRSIRRCSARTSATIVDLGIMGQQRDRGVAVERRLLQRFVRPFGDERRVGKALGRRKAGARVDDRHGRSRRCRAIGASAWLICTAPIIDEPHRGNLHGEEIAAGLHARPCRSCPSAARSPAPRQADRRRSAAAVTKRCGAVGEATSPASPRGGRRARRSALARVSSRISRPARHRP